MLLIYFSDYRFSNCDARERKYEIITLKLIP